LSQLELIFGEFRAPFQQPIQDSRCPYQIISVDYIKTETRRDVFSSRCSCGAEMRRTLGEANWPKAKLPIQSMTLFSI
jgi:hypothetical protein